MRQEGAYWKAYYTVKGTHIDRIELGSIAMSAVVDKPDRRALFMDLMCEVVADMVEEQFGIRPTWGGETQAPECERAGNA